MVRNLTKTEIQTTKKQPKWLVFFVIIVITLGAIFRFTNLALKPYWHDEIYTSLRISGYTSGEVVEQIYNRIIGSKDILRYQCPSQDKKLSDTVRGLAVEDSQHPPLYYPMITVWTNWFGCSVTVIRSLSVIFSLLTLPVTYLLCRELFQSPTVGWMAIALISVSPIHIRYAQEARQYSLLAFLTLLSSVALLKAIKQNNLLGWSLYATTVSLNLYCHLLSFFVLVGHGIYVAASNGLRKSKVLIGYLLASLAGFATFLPWLKILVDNKSQAERTTNWLSNNIAFLSLIKKWGINLSRIFISWDYELNEWLIYLSIPILLLSLYSFYIIYKKNDNSVWLFIFTLIGTTIFSLVGIDIVRTGQSSSIAQYLFPSYLGIQICVAYLLATKITSPPAHKKQIQFWSIITAILFSASILSSGIASQAETWWNWSKFDVEAAKVINSYSNPLVISDAYFGAIAPLSYELKPEAKLVLVNQNKVELPIEFKNIFLYQASDRLLNQIKQKGNAVDLAYQFPEESFVVSLFRVVNQNTR